MIVATATPVASAAPAGSAHPIPPPDPEPAASGIAGSTWRFCGTANDTVTFEANGSVVFRRDGVANGKGFTCGNARWTQENDRLTFDCNQFTEYVVTVARKEMRGEWHRVRDPKDRGATCLQRVP